MSRLLTTLLIWASLLQPVHSDESVRIAMAEWPPLSATALPQHGVLAQVINEAFATQGMTVQYGFFPAEEAYAHVKEGRWQASGAWQRTQEREAECWFSGVIYRSQTVLLYNRSKPITWDGSVAGAEQLKGLRIGIAPGSSKLAELEEAEQRGWVRYEEGDGTLNLHKLAAAQIDAIQINQDVANHSINQHLSAVEQASLAMTQAYHTEDYHLAFSRRLSESERLQQAFAQGLRQLKESGRYAQIWQTFSPPAAP
jgi:polar amino acid transport system substrate-binding protein